MEADSESEEEKKDVKRKDNIKKERLDDQRKERGKVALKERGNDRWKGAGKQKESCEEEAEKYRYYPEEMS